MIPATSHPTWAKLIRGELEHEFSSPTVSLLFFNLRNSYRRDTSSLAEQVGAARRFFERYEKTLGPDIQKLFG